MSGDPFIKPIAGQRFRPSARAFSASIDTAVDGQLHRLNQTQERVPGAELPPHIYVINQTSLNRDQGDIMGLGNLAVWPTTEDPQPSFLPPLYYGVSPNRLIHGGRFCILLEPIDHGRIGRAVFRGAAWWCKLTHLRAWHEFCDPRDGNFSNLCSSQFGSTRIVEFDAATGWAVVAIGNPDHRFFARITAAAGGARHSYSWEEVDLTGTGYGDWIHDADYCRSGNLNARNTAEEPDFDVQQGAVPADSVVLMHEMITAGGTPSYWFTLAVSAALVARDVVVGARWDSDEYQVLVKTYKVVDESIGAGSDPPQNGTWVKWLDTTHCEE